jgi:hypothetical protein
MNSEPNLYFDRKPVPNFPALLHSYNRDEFDSPYRSTVPLLALLRDKQNTLLKILSDCQASMQVDFHFEFKVGQSEGRGKPSHTDLMAISDAACIAVESKWTEPPYENIASWFSKGADKSNREKVLEGWLALLHPGQSSLSPIEVADCEYQMLHRAASACATASSFTSKKPVLAYFKFISSDTPFSAATAEYYRAGLALLHKRLRLVHFPFLLVEIQIAPSEDFGLLTQLEATGTSVRTALQETSLFDFVSYKVEQIAT